MTKLPRIKAKDLIRALHKTEFQTLRTKGSHHFLSHKDGRATVVPVHAGETLGTGLLVRILRDTDLTRDELIKLLQ